VPIDPAELPVPAKIGPWVQPAQSITYDSRRVGPGIAFAALPGATTHGNAYLEDALERGAPFVLTDRAGPRAVQVAEPLTALKVWAEQRRLRLKEPIIAVTGSVGKTSAKHALSWGLQLPSPEGNLNTEVALACFLLGQDSGPLVLELGIDRVGEMDQLVDLVRPDLAAITAIGAAHLSGLGDLGGVAREKGKIFRGTRFGLVGPLARAWFPGRPSYGFGGGSWPASQLRFEAGRAHFLALGRAITVPSPSAALAEAALLAVVIASELRYDLGDVASRLAELPPLGGRQRILSGPLTLIDDCYNANPLSMQAALELLARLEGRKVAVLGDMLELGESSQALHLQVGCLASQAADLVFSVGDYRSQLSSRPARSLEELTAWLLQELREGDTVLFKASRAVGLERVLRAVQEKFLGSSEGV
jgi:UDP-N-acetylmuramoyl-tripeptide--D-alanyl-D-alanine ligase